MNSMTQSDSVTGYSRGEAARFLGLSPERIAQLGRAGRLAYTQTPLGRVYKAASVEAYAIAREQRRQGTQA